MNFLNKFVDIVISKRKFIEKIFWILVILNLICAPFVKVNYDMTEYLPKTSQSQQALSVMEDEFGYPGTARVMIEDVTLYEAQHYKERIEQVKGVDTVTWADTANNIYQSGAFLATADLDDYYKDGSTVMDIIFDEKDSSPVTYKAINEIKKITGSKGYFMGSAVQSKSLSETLAKEVAIASAVAVVFIIAILCFTTTSWFEPVLLLIIMAIAIIINMGSNLLLGTVSFFTFSVAPLLQLAVAIDYSIFLLHAYAREKKPGLSQEEIVRNALRSSFKSVFSCGIITGVGFLMLTLMKFTIGRDLGIVLAKGIIISLFTVLTLMPSLIIRSSNLIQRTEHRPAIRSFDKLANGLFKIRYPLLAVIIVITIPMFVAKDMNSFLFGNGALGSAPGTQLYRDKEKINNLFGSSNMLIAVVPNTDMVKEKELADELEDLDYTKNVTSLAGILPEGVPESIIPNSILKQVHTKDYARIIINIKTNGESDLAFACTDEIRSIIKSFYPDNSYLLGETTVTKDIKDIIVKDYTRVDALSIIAMFIVVMLTFGSVILPLQLILPIEMAIYINMGIPYLWGDTMIYMGYIIVSCVQLAATIDYSILVTNNYLISRQTCDKRQSVHNCVTDSAMSVMASGLILTIVGYGLYFISTVSAIADIGRLVGRGAFIGIIMVLGVFPTLLYIFDRPIIAQQQAAEKLKNWIYIKLHKHNKKFKVTIK